MLVGRTDTSCWFDVKCTKIIIWGIQITEKIIGCATTTDFLWNNSQMNNSLTIFLVNSFHNISQVPAYLLPSLPGLAHSCHYAVSFTWMLDCFLPRRRDGRPDFLESPIGLLYIPCPYWCYFLPKAMSRDSSCLEVIGLWASAFWSSCHSEKDLDLQHPCMDNEYLWWLSPFDLIFFFLLCSSIHSYHHVSKLAWDLVFGENARETIG